MMDPEQPRPEPISTEPNSSPLPTGNYQGTQLFTPHEARSIVNKELKSQQWKSNMVIGIFSLSTLILGACVLGLAVYAASERKRCSTPTTELPSTWTLIEPLGVRPPPRLAHGACAIDSRMYIHGGLFGYANDTLGDLWMYDEPSDTWHEISTTGDVPPARLHHTLIDLDQTTLLVFGGFNVFNLFPTHTSYSDFYSLDLNTKVWTRLDTKISGAAPTKRGAHDAIVANGAFFVYGGFPTIAATGHLRELWKFTWSTQTWTNITPSSSSTAFPDPRIGFTWAVVGNQALLFGGGCATGSVTEVHGQCNDLWSYNWLGNVWTQVHAANPPLPRRATHGDVAVFGILYLYGGVYINTTLGSPVPVMLDDLQAYDPQTNQWMRIYPNFGRGVRPPKVFGHSVVRLGSKVVLFGGREAAPTSWGTNNIWEYHTIPPV